MKASSIEVYSGMEKWAASVKQRFFPELWQSFPTWHTPQPPPHIVTCALHENTPPEVDLKKRMISRGFQNKARHNKNDPPVLIYFVQLYTVNVHVCVFHLSEGDAF